MSLQKYTRLAMFFAGIAIFLSTHNFFSGCRNLPGNKGQVQTNHNEPDQTSRLLVPIGFKIQELSEQNANLITEIETLKSSLSGMKRKAAASERRLTELLAENDTLTDTVSIIESCDSIKESALVFIKDSKQKDSLYESIVTQLHTRIANRDSVIALHAKQISILHAGYEQERLERLLAENLVADLTTRNKKQRRLNRWLTGAIVVVGGSAAILLSR